jgi:endonuclease/exonuclease/phosphatase (EEP) superfamily protein YafD
VVIDAVRPPPERPLRTTGMVRGLALAVAWILTAGVAVAVATRLVGLTDRRERLFALAALTVWLLVPCLVALVTGAVLRARLLVVVDAALLVVLLTWVAPDLRWWSTAAAIEGPTSVVAAANIGPDHDDVAATSADLLDLGADVLVVVELTQPSMEGLHAAGVDEQYPYAVEDARPGTRGSAIYSRYPMRARGVEELGGARMARATVELPGGAVTVVAVHTTQPLASLRALRDQLERLGTLVEEIDGPVVLAGDFNATRQHQPFRELLDTGLTDAHLATGRGWSATWPAGHRFPPFALIDHVLVSGELSVASAGEVTITGTDHRAVVAEVGRSSS